MTPLSDGRTRFVLERIARAAMASRGFEPDFPPRALDELRHIAGPARPGGAPARTRTDLPWCSIDNDDSRDLDQLTAAEALADGAARIHVAIADVDAVVRKASALDDHARRNTTSVYTAGAIFSMLPERLSTDLTSLGQGEDRLALVVAFTVAVDGSLSQPEIFRALVRNRAKLAYDSVAAWLEGKGPEPPGIAPVSGLADNLKLQDTAAQRLRARRHAKGALSLETTRTRPVFEGAELTGLAIESSNRAKGLIEDFMIAANETTVRHLAAAGYPALRRIVRVPKNWPRLVDLAREMGSVLPGQPDAAALERFLVRARAADPAGFSDLSLCVIKLLGRGEYVATSDGTAPGHFGLAVDDYTHSTAPNRRFPDLVTQRILKASLDRRPAPYAAADLATLGTQCTERADAAKKIERQVAKSAAALLLRPRIGERFEALVTGASDKGTWVRLSDPPVEGKLVAGFEGKLVGDRLRIRLVRADVEHGHVDFAAAQ